MRSSASDIVRDATTGLLLASDATTTPEYDEDDGAAAHFVAGCGAPCAHPSDSAMLAPTAVLRESDWKTEPERMFLPPAS
jgi:hypothetical protein